MKLIVMTVKGGDDLSAEADPRFGRGERFLVVDADSDEVQRVVPNPSLEAAHGAGTGAAALMGELGAKAVVSGAFGPKAHSTLKALGIEMFTAGGGTAGEVLAAFKAGELEKVG